MRAENTITKIFRYGVLLMASMLLGCNESNELPVESWTQETAEEKAASANIPLNISEETMDIKEIDEEFNILFIADSHISLCDSRDQDLSFKALQRSTMYKTDGIEAWDRFDALMDEAKRGNYDIILLGGDIVDSAMYASIDFVEGRLGKLNKPYLYSMGNHDFEYGNEYFSAKAYEEYLPRLKELRDGTPYQIREYEDVTVFTADDDNNQIAGEVLEAYKKEAAKGKPMVLVLHVPLEPVTGSKALLKHCEEKYGKTPDERSKLFIGKDGCRPNSVTQEFIDNVLSDKSPVVLILAGHIHFYHKEMLNDRVLQIVTDPAFAGGGIRVRLK